MPKALLSPGRGSDIRQSINRFDLPPRCLTVAPSVRWTAFTDLYGKAISAQRDAVQAVVVDEAMPLRERRTLVRELEREEGELYDTFVDLFKETVRPEG